ncbi:DUF2334 domain-containing protein [Inconstantimicrobium mannanitabidum]|uniref:Uncharacterized protein n=1 Tax=Inconstantimicrobium mannanitabidum TaxID=1604901 RepID=A0ACB5RAD5_9CLOT|nr:DUF2334 domain-containing protein [Clostridium sp. TW13]GKX66057.1 hypothetical protein rsdtw13_13150 [Clostridium sp. TW13]
MSKTKIILKTMLKLVGIILALTILAFICKIIVFSRDTVSNITVQNSMVQKPITLEKKLPNFENAVMASSNTNDKINNSSNVSLFYEGRKLNINTPTPLINLRYYLDLEDFLKTSSINFSKKENKYYIDNCIVDLNSKTFNLAGKTYNFRGQNFVKDTRTYICLNDIEHILNLRDYWDNVNKKIYLFKDKKNIHLDSTSIKTTGPVALIRFEDVASTSSTGNNEDLEKFKIMGDYLYENGIKFNITWVPRYKNPGAGIDNDLLTHSTMTNAQFINTLDHLIFRGATIGLHGYTHQHGNTTSTVGTELDSKNNTTPKEVQAIAENGLKVANTFNIPVAFFESPHYQATRTQQKILEKYFRILYEPVSGYWNLNPMKTSTTLYVPAPLGYVQDEHGEALAKKIRKNYSFMLTSVFIHPFKELKFIKLKPVDSTGYCDYSYENNTPVKNIVKALQDTKHVTISVDNLLKK